MAFVKLDCGILNSTLWVEREPRDVFLTALLMAVPRELTEPMPQFKVDAIEPTGFIVPPGWYGFVEAAGPGIVRRSMAEMEPGMKALAKLGEPDLESRSSDFDGRRLVRVDGGFVVLNYMKYRDKDNTAAVRQARYRERQREKGQLQEGGKSPPDEPSPSRRDSNANVTKAEAEAEAEEIQATVKVGGTTTLVGASEPKKPVKRPSKKAPASFLVEADLQHWARENVPGLDIRHETEKFRDHTFARAITDWPGAWRNWMRKAYEPMQTPNPQQSLLIPRRSQQPVSRQAALEQRNADVAARFKAKMTEDSDAN